MRTALSALSGLSLALAFSGCTETQTSAPPPQTPQTTSVRMTESSPADQSARIGTSNAAQSFTPGPTPKALKTALRTKWKAQIGKSGPRATMELAGGRIVVAAEDGVHVLDALSGERRALVRAPDGTAVEGAAVDRDAIFFTTARGAVVRASLAGAVTWSVPSGYATTAGPGLTDTNGDGVRDAIVGTAAGTVAAFDGKTGKKLWQTTIGSDGRRGVEAGVVIGDIDRDGKDEIVAAGGEGTLAVLRADTGAIAWKTKLSSRMIAAPTLVDLDAHGGLEILTAWADGRIAIFDGKGGDPLWSAQLETDAGELDAVSAAPVAVPAAAPNVGFVVVATSGGSKKEGLVVLGEHERRFRSIEGRVTATPVVLRLDAASAPAAIVGTQAGDIVGLDAAGGRTLLGFAGAPIDASPLVADVDGDGLRELLVVTRDGALTCWSTGATDAPLLDRQRGAHAAVNLGWSFVRGRNDARVFDQRLRTP